MASGKVHTKWNLYNLAGIGALSAVRLLAGRPEQAAGLITGAVLGILVTPDIDHHAYTIEERRIKHLFGAPFAFLWRLYWTPYERLLGHRNPLSHCAGPATLLRAIYLFAPLLAAAHFLQVDIIPYILNTFTLHALAAWTSQDVIHLALDDYGKKRKRAHLL